MGSLRSIRRKEPPFISFKSQVELTVMVKEIQILGQALDMSFEELDKTERDRSIFLWRVVGFSGLLFVSIIVVNYLL